MDAATNHEWFRSGDLTHDERWPRWASRAAGLGVGSLLSIPLRTTQRPIGALNLYPHTQGRSADQHEVDFALTFAAHVAVALAGAATDRLTIALRSRHTIGVAQEILIEGYDLTVDQSFDRLRRYSSHTNTKVIALAQQIIATGRLAESNSHTDT